VSPQDVGALSIISSDAQAMGRVGEVVIRTWQTAHQMKLLRGYSPGDGRNDNHRARRYVAKHTICPAVAHGLEREIGSVEVGKMADLVLWQSALFGVRPHDGVQGATLGTRSSAHRPGESGCWRGRSGGWRRVETAYRRGFWDDVGRPANALLAQVGEFVRGERAH